MWLRVEVSEEKEGAYVFTACSVNAAERDGGTNSDVSSSTRYTMRTASRREEVYSGSLNPPRDGGGGKEGWGVGGGGGREK